MGPYLAGYRFSLPNTVPPHGVSVDRMDSDDWRPLAIARAGILPMFVLSALAVWLWARRSAGALAALFSVALFALDPSVLAHAGLATTDIEFTAAFCGPLLAFVVWWETPTSRTASVAGLLFGAALASKYEGLALVPCAVAAAAVLAWGRIRPRLPARSIALHAALAAVVAFVVVWATYRFSFGALASQLDARTLARLDHDCSSSTSCSAIAWLASKPMPAPASIDGLWEFLWEERAGHPSYLLGAWSMHGFAAYYSVGLLVKTPIPELLLAAGGLAWALRNDPRDRAARIAAPVAAAVALVAVASSSGINIGVRHVLPVLPLLSIAGGRALAALMSDVQGSLAARRAAQALAGGLGAWLAFGSLRAHPEYLGYFNEAVGSDGDLVLLDSDLDWGQDLWRLESVLREHGVDRVHLLYFGPAVLGRHALPEILPLERNVPVPGWIAISAMYRQFPGFEWLGAYEPVARVGRSIDLYLVP